MFKVLDVVLQGQFIKATVRCQGATDATFVRWSGSRLRHHWCCCFHYWSSEGEIPNTLHPTTYKQFFFSNLSIILRHFVNCADEMGAQPFSQNNRKCKWFRHLHLLHLLLLHYNGTWNVFSIFDICCLPKTKIRFAYQSTSITPNNRS